MVLKRVGLNTIDICKTLFKVMIPVSIVMKILTELGLISYIGDILSPVMSLAGLPGAYGIVWAAALCTNVYAAIIVFLSIFPDEPITKAQITVLSIMVLTSHNVPIECGIDTRVGIKLKVSVIYKLVMGVLAGIVFGFIFSFFNLYNTAPQIFLTSTAPAEESLLSWALGELRLYFTIVVIIFFLNIIIKILERSGALIILIKILRPVLKHIGIGRNAIPVTIIGTVLGYAYAGGFFIKESKAGKIKKKEFLYTVFFVTSHHAVIEDNILMISIGGAAFPIIAGRFLFTYAVCMIIYRVTRNMKEETFLKFFFQRKVLEKDSASSPPGSPG
ncbi:MAG: hypothetical protein FWC36_08030 [Spirochaetes bacterium]|nr:hypothetical protein [Spirochaetota bacterium]